jgi:predicted  nucleic acid-binding Zn-ribbon protein
MIKQVKINECTCENPKCGHTWLSRKPEPPLVCPRCGNRKWNEVKNGVATEMSLSAYGVMELAEEGE